MPETAISPMRGYCVYTSPLVPNNKIEKTPNEIIKENNN